jgi:hypothetical protein
MLMMRPKRPLSWGIIWNRFEIIRVEGVPLPCFGVQSMCRRFSNFVNKRQSHLTSSAFGWWKRGIAESSVFLFVLVCSVFCCLMLAPPLAFFSETGIGYR